MPYQERFGNSTIEEKRRDLMGNPLFDPEKLKKLTDDIIAEIHESYFEAMNKAMEEVIGESMY